MTVDEFLNSENDLLPVRQMAYGPVVGEHHDAAMFGPNRNPLGVTDVAASPDTGLGQGDLIMAEDGTLHTVADWSYLHPDQPTHGTIEFRDRHDQGHGFIRKVNSVDDFLGLPKTGQSNRKISTVDDFLGISEAPNATPPTDVPPGGGLSDADLAQLIASRNVPTYAPQLVTPDEQAVPDSSDDEHDLLYYKTGKTKSEREALNKPLREAMQVPAVSPETIKKGLEAVSSIGATRPEDLQQGPVEKSINDEIARAVSGMTTGEGISSLPLYAFPATAAGLTAENVQELPGQIGETAEKIKAGDYPGAASAGTRAALNALMTLGVLHGAGELTGGERAGIETPSRAEPPPAQVPPEVSAAPVAPTMPEPELFPQFQTGRIEGQTARISDVKPEGQQLLPGLEAAPPPPIGTPLKPVPLLGPPGTTAADVAAAAELPVTPQAPAAATEPIPTAFELPGTRGISQARTEAELGPGSVEPGVGAEMGTGLDFGRDYINKGGDPRLPIRRANTSGLVGKNEVGIVHAELERLRGERSKAASALEANPADPVLQQNFSVADDAQRAWRKELQPVLTKASDALKEAHAASMPDADASTYQGLADLMDEHFNGQREVTPEMRTAMAKAAKGVKDTRDIANGEMKNIEETLTRKAGGKRVLTPEELDARIRTRLEGEFADCVPGG